MTAKDYFRNLALHDLDIQIDPTLINFDDCLIKRLSNLKYYTIADRRVYYKKLIYRNYFSYNYNTDNIKIGSLYTRQIISFRKKLSIAYPDFEIIIKAYIEKVCNVDFDTFDK